MYSTKIVSGFHISKLEKEEQMKLKLIHTYIHTYMIRVEINEKEKRKPARKTSN